MKNTDEALAKILNELADKLGVTVNHLFAIMIKQSYITGIECFIGIIPLSLMLWLFIKIFNKERGEDTITYFLEDNYGWVMIGFIVGSVSLIGITFCLIDGTNALLNPEYFALHQILK